jgi:hypothetical protein
MLVHLSMTVDMAKDLKELNFGYNNGLSYDTSHHGISLFAIIGVLMATSSKQRRYGYQFLRTSN